MSTHGLMFLIASAVGLGLSGYTLSTQQFRRLLNSVPWVVLGSLIGARFFYLISRPESWPDVASWFRFWEGGMVSHGGLVGCIAVLWIRHGSADGLEFFDRLAGPSLVAWGVGRIGCLLTWYGEEGTPANVPWALVVEGTARHPVTAYLAILYISGGLLLMKFGGGGPGRGAAAALIYFAAMRAVCDQWREYEPNYLRTLSRITCMFFAAAGFALYRPLGTRSKSSRARR